MIIIIVRRKRSFYDLAMQLVLFVLRIYNSLILFHIKKMVLEVMVDSENGFHCNNG